MERGAPRPAPEQEPAGTARPVVAAPWARRRRRAPAPRLCEARHRPSFSSLSLPEHDGRVGTRVQPVAVLPVDAPTRTAASRRSLVPSHPPMPATKRCDPCACGAVAVAILAAPTRGERAAVADTTTRRPHPAQRSRSAARGLRCYFWS